MPTQQTYWGYWINVLQEMRVKMEYMDRRLKRMEDEIRQAPKPATATAATPVIPPQPAVAGGSVLGEKELTGCMALKEIGKPASVEEINEHLKKTRRIDESVKETLFMRLRGAIEKGYIGFDQKEKKFGLLKTSFVVE